MKAQNDNQGQETTRRWEDSISFLAVKLQRRDPKRSYHDCFTEAKAIKAKEGA